MSEGDGPILLTSAGVETLRKLAEEAGAEARQKVLELAQEILARQLGQAIDVKVSDDDVIRFGLARGLVETLWAARSHVEMHRKVATDTGGLGRAIRIALSGVVLEGEKEHAELAADDVSCVKLAVELGLSMTRLVESLRDGDRYVCEEGPIEEDGMLALDARAAAHVESLGDHGKALAEEFRLARRIAWDCFDLDAHEQWEERRRASVESLASKLDALKIAIGAGHSHEALGVLGEHQADLDDAGPDPRVALLSAWAHKSGSIASDIETLLARALWRDVVGPRLARERRKPASLVRPVHVAATAYHSRGPRYDEKTSSLTFEGRRVAELTGGAYDIEVIQRGLGLLGSVVSHELFHWQVMTGHQQYLAGSSLPHIIEVDGGTEAICSKIGVNPKKHAANVRALLAAQAAAVFTFPDGSRGNMLVLNEMPARGRRRAHTRIELGSMLMPGYVHESLTKLAQRDRKLVPMLRERVPLYGRANEHGEQRTMSLTMVATLRDKATELVTEGGALITDDDFLRLADRSGLPRRLIIPVREVWLTGDDRAVPFLKRTGRDRYTLADPHELERDFIEEGGRLELEGARAGEKGAAKKRGKLARLGRK